jgi:hypothetical protein
VAQQSEIEITFEDEDAEHVIAALGELGATDIEKSEDHGLTGIEIALVAWVVTAAIPSLVSKLHAMWRTGIIVDARTSRVTTEKNRDLPRGHVLVLTADGAQHELHEPSREDLAQLIGGMV